MDEVELEKYHQKLMKAGMDVQDAVVLEPLGRKHGQRLGDLVVTALDACPLHGGVIGLRLLNDSLVHLIDRIPIGIIAVDLGRRARAFTAHKILCVLLRVSRKAEASAANMRG